MLGRQSKSLWDSGRAWYRFPSVKTPGYFRSALRAYSDIVVYKGQGQSLRLRCATGETPVPPTLMQVLLVNTAEGALPAGTADLIGDLGWEITSAPNYRAALEAAGTEAIDVVILPEPDGEYPRDTVSSDFGNLMRLIDARRIAGVVLTEHPRRSVANPRSLVDPVGREVSLAELRGRLAMIERYHGLVKRMERELADMQRLGKRLSEHFQEVDQEMRLAARLQRDFLPKLKDPIENVQFASVYRPASWVSGDMFDVFRVDEEHTGFYVADAVGHGLASGLLTMFIKRAIISKRIEEGRYKVLTPSETLAALNDALAGQSLPNCQFVTACYAMLNHRTLKLQYARGGHPYPVLLTDDGIVSELKSSGGLLGISQDEDFPTFETQLHPGDKLLLYTDGVELVFPNDRPDSVNSARHLEAFRSLGNLPIQTMMMHIDSLLNDDAGSQSPRDDVTIVGLEVLSRQCSV